MSNAVHDVLRGVAEILEVPVVVILILFLAFAVFSIGWLIVEFFTERRLMRASVPQLMDELRDAEREDISDIIRGSGLLTRQKNILRELLWHPDFTPGMREGLAANLLEGEQSHYDRAVRRTELASKLSPMFGLLGTLIPLGPGIIALGQGDTVTLSASLLTAFDTTVAGLIAAAVFLVITTIRKRWYNLYMNDLEALTECVLELEREQ